MRPYFKRYRPSKRSSTSRQTRRQRLSSSHQQKTQSTSGSQTKTTDPYVDLLNLFGSWSKVGSQYTQQIPPGKPLPDNELKACTDRGITFIQALGSGGFGTVWKCSLSQPLSDRTGRPTYDGGVRSAQ
ncbi:uncharacterized protein LOC128966238 [Oppia nitens]|uniref:uncharacterized protein LOC128966238 n=1 Tax=Oppia nitens TaxID=1686743 RepID=UPI0023DC0C35|nr:uncharacterized protein LOC128966238 [Oppia nitens]